METPKDRVTLKDVAKHSGYGLATVSIVLRGDKRLPEATRLIIKRCAEELGYKPDPMLSALAAYRKSRKTQKYQGTIAYVTNWATREQWREVDSFISFYDGVVNQGNELGYEVEHCWLREPGLSRERICRILINRGIKGLILGPLPQAFGHMKLDWDRFCSVALGYSLTCPALNFSVSNQPRALELAWHQLRREGYRRIGLALRRHHDRRVKRLWSSTHAAQQLEHAGICQSVPSLMNEDWDKAALKKWFLQIKPDVVITATPEAKMWLEETGAKCPEDFGFALLNVYPFGSEFSGIHELPDQIGRSAMWLLNLMLQIGEVGVPAARRGILTDPVWNVGKTTRGKLERRGDLDP